MPDHDRFWTVAEVAAHYKLHPDTIRKWARQGALEAHRVQRELRFTERAVRALERPTRPPDPT